MQAGLQAPGAVGSASKPYMRFISNKELDEKAAAMTNQQADIEPPLTAHIRRAWEQARRAKETIQREILQDYRQRKGDYDPDVLAKIKEQGGSDIYMMLTANKCRSLEAWINDVMLPADDKAWELEATPIVDIPPPLEEKIQMQVMFEAQQAFATNQVVDREMIVARMEELREKVKERAKELADDAANKMEDQIEDDLTEGGWDDAFSQILFDFVTTKACFIHGPIMRKRVELKWQQDFTTGHWKPEMVEVIKKEYERRSPLDIYPSPGAEDIDDGFLFDHQRIQPSDLYALVGTPGFKEDKIKAVLDEHQAGGLMGWLWHDQERARIEQKDTSLFDNAERRIDTLVYNGPIPGKLLAEWGQEVEDPYQEIEVQAWLIGRHVVGLRMNNNPGSKRPYSKASLEQTPGAFWGNGLAYILRDISQMCNAAARAISNNAGISSGPQVVINDTSRIPDNEDVTNMYPWKIWQFGPDKQGGSGHRPPIEFFQPNSMTSELMATYDKFSGMADEFVPSYFNGNQDIGGAGRTASGLSMLMSQATKTVKHAISNLDRGVVRRVVHMTYLLEMLFNPDPSIKGDLMAVPRGAVSLLAKEQQQVRRAEFLNSTANQFDMEIMGLAGRATILRESARSLDLPIDEIVPDKESMESMALQNQVQQQVQQVIETLAQALGVNPEVLLQMLGQASGPQAVQQPQQPQTLDAAGSPVAGQDMRLFN